MEVKELKKYIIKKTKTDMITSLKALNKTVLKEQYNKHGVDNINDLKEAIIDKFKLVLDLSKDDIFTQMFFERLVKNENTNVFSAYTQDVRSLLVFVY